MLTSAGAARRSRSRSGGGNMASCLVDGCVSDLSKCRDYHKRHKVCEAHSKTPIVLVGGREQRFCQQCSRFHTLSEFDEGKRSCRKRLDGHNRRRRKPHLETLNTGSFLTSHQGTGFSLQQEMNPIPTMPETNWVDFSVRSDRGVLNCHRLPLHSPFLQQSEAAVDADRAFSLLSSSAQSSHLNLSPAMYAAGKIPIGQTSQQGNGEVLYPCFQPCMPTEDGAHLHCQDLFQGTSKMPFEGTCDTPALHWQW